MDEIRQQLRGFITKRFMEGLDPSSLKDEQSLERSHIVDSVATLEIILFLEETFGLNVENEDATPENFDSINSLVAYVQRKAGQR